MFAVDLRRFIILSPLITGRTIGSTIRPYALGPWTLVSGLLLRCDSRWRHRSHLIRIRCPLHTVKSLRSKAPATLDIIS